MKKVVFILLLLFMFTGCGEDISYDVTSNSDFSPNLSNKVGSPRDSRLTFFDINEYGLIRPIINNLSDNTGGLYGRVQFAQTHTIDPNNNEQNREPSLIPYRDALLLFTPEVEVKSLKAIVYNGSKKQEYNMLPPKYMPRSDYRGNGSLPDITYSKRSWNTIVRYSEITPNMKIEFIAQTVDNRELKGSLEGSDIEFAAPIEAVFLFVKLGLLTNPPTPKTYPYDFTMIDDPARAMAEYFQTVPLAKVVNGYYEERQLKPVILSSGKIYDTVSDYPNPDGHSGDMREDVAKAQVSVGINLANKGVSSSPLNQNHDLPNDMFYFTVHFAQGNYKKGVVGHGLSGGNGIGTLFHSSGNEFSHEVGHGYGLGHYPNKDEGTDGSVHGYTTGWGYDAYKNRMKANIQWGKKVSEPYGWWQWTIFPFQQIYAWNQDSQSDGENTGSVSRYTHNTARQTRLTQKNLSKKYFLTDSKHTDGKYRYNEWDAANREIRLNGNMDFQKQRINPTEKGVPVITILGGYDPDNPSQTVLYPYFRGNYGNIFGELFVNEKPANTNTYLEISYYNNKATQYVALADERHAKRIINKLHVNIPESDKPKTITLFVKGQNKGTTTIEENVYAKPLPAPIIIGKEKGYEDVIKADIIKLNGLLKDKNVSDYILTTEEKDIIDILNTFGRIKDLEANTKNIAQDRLSKKAKIDGVDDYIDNNYHELESGNENAVTGLKDILQKNGLGKLEFKFSQAIINGRCLEVYENEEGIKYVRTSDCRKDISQRWNQDNNGRIHSALYTGYCLNGSNISQMQLCNESKEQRFKYREDGGYENIGRPNQCIDNNNGSGNRHIITYTCNNSQNQKFSRELEVDNNIYFSLMEGSLINELWKYIKIDGANK